MIIPIKMNGKHQHNGAWTFPAGPDWPPSPQGVLVHPRVTELMGKKPRLQKNGLQRIDATPVNFGLPTVHNVRQSTFSLNLL